MVKLAAQVMMGEKLKNLDYGINLYKKPNIIAVKVPVFSTEKLGGIEVSLGPEMKSTGEALGIGKTIDAAIYKGLLGAYRIHEIKNKIVPATIKKTDKKEFLELAKRLIRQGCRIIGTTGTKKYLNENNVKCEK